jgi:hypothetical protein
MVASSELNLPEADRAALDASLWAWRAVGIDAALTTWQDMLASARAPGHAADMDGAPDLAGRESPVTADDAQPGDPVTADDVLPPAGVAVPDPYALGHPAGVQAVTVIPELRRIECLVGDSVDYGSLWKSLRSLTSAEWTACVLTSLGRMATAHEELRGTPVRLQGWWRGEDRAVHFTADQVC